MHEKCAAKDNIENEKKRPSLQFPAFWFTCFVVWIFVIKQMMHFLVIIIVLYSSATYSSPVPTTSQPVFNSPISHIGQESFGGFPQFLSVHQLVDVLEGSTAVMDCRLVNLGIQHTVSWMRSSDMSVLTVGGLVFSSDPRIGVVSPRRPGQTIGTWSLQIREATVRDSGDYQCQVNSEPKESLDVTLVVRGKVDELLDLNEDKEIYSVFRHISIPEPTNPQLNIPNISHKETFTNVSNLSIVKMLSPISTPPEESELEIERNATDKFGKTQEIGTNHEIVLPSPTEPDPTANVLYKQVEPPSDLEMEIFEGENLQKSVKQIARKTESVLPVPEPHPTASETHVQKDNSKDTNSLMIPIISLSIVVILIISLGSIRGFYSRYVDTKHTKTTASRSRSTTRTVDSRRSSGSRSSDEAVYNSSKKLRRKERELELERMVIYDEIRHIHKARLSPLIEVIEPTPPLYRRSPIFLMTSLEIPGSSDESEYEADRSDVTGNTKISENVDMPDHNSVASENMVENIPQVSSRYETVRSLIRTLLADNSLLQRQGEEEGGSEEGRRTRTKLVDNVNTFL